MKYTVVGTRDQSKFEERVNDLIKEGWKPQGGIFIVVDNNGWIYYQAMVK